MAGFYLMPPIDLPHAHSKENHYHDQECAKIEDANLVSPKSTSSRTMRRDRLFAPETMELRWRGLRKHAHSTCMEFVCSPFKNLTVTGFCTQYERGTIHLTDAKKKDGELCCPPPGDLEKMSKHCDHVARKWIIHFWAALATLLGFAILAFVAVHANYWYERRKSEGTSASNEAATTAPDAPNHIRKRVSFLVDE